jgi:cation diffusion facilitator family transporter
MKFPGGSELPPDQTDAHRRAVRLEWITIVYMVSVIVLLYFTLGQSQAMKAAWFEDIVTLIPPAAFLIASRFRDRPPNARFAFGYHRAMSVAYVVASFFLFFLGAFILFDSVERLIVGTHPPIGMVEIFNQQVWLGYVMIGALIYAGIPPIILGRMKQKPAAALHDKVLNADARMNRADWMTAGAATAGIIGIGLGIWWADAAAAIVISLDITRDGAKYLRESAADLMDERPATYDESHPHPARQRVAQELADTEWIRESALRLREHGHMISGDIWVVPAEDQAGLAARLEDLGTRLTKLDWSIHDLAVAPVQSLEDVPDGLLVKRGEVLEEPPQGKL